MKGTYFTPVLFILCAAVVILALNMANNGPHGGIIKKTDEFFIEMKNNPDTTFLVWLLDQRQKTLSNKEVTGNVKFLFPDSTATDIELKRTKDNAFTAKTITGYNSCKIILEVYGKIVSAQFEKQEQVAQTRSKNAH